MDHATSTNPQDAALSALTTAFAPKKAISYIRVSTQEQAKRGGRDEGFSLPAQRDVITQKAHSLGALIVKEFVEPGNSGRTIAKRPVMREMLAWIKEHPDVDYLIIHKLDRLARNRDDDSDITRLIRDQNIQLVSTLENIDQTPAGLMMHGIMATIAEFYSNNLSQEVTKGMTQKVKYGGTPHKAPLGYKNIRVMADNGYEMRTVAIDEVRASLVQWAFEAYASGEWTLNTLTEELRSRGLSYPATRKMPERLIGMRTLHSILSNPYYIGMVKFKGALHEGTHPPLICPELFNTVQAVLESKRNGERTCEHPHFLKSTLFCGNCNSRMSVTVATSRAGDRYPYFVCLGRNRKRTDCKAKYAFISTVEERIEEFYEQISLPESFREKLEQNIRQAITESRAGLDEKIQQLSSQKQQLERQQRKLLEAHYNDAVPLDLLKEEQSRLSAELSNINQRLDTAQVETQEYEEAVTVALDLAQNCGKAYKTAPDHIKKQFNQVFFERILVHSDNDGICTEPVYQPPFDLIFESSLASENQEERPGRSLDLSRYPSSLSDCSIFSDKGSMVDTGGFEPPTSRLSAVRSNQLSYASP